MSSSKQEIADISASHASAREAVEHAIKLMKQALAKARYVIPQGETKAYLEMRRDIPYFIHETEIEGTQILVNRNYKPLGSNARASEDWVKYEDVKNMHVSLSAEQIASVVSAGRKRGLFGDDDAPWFGRRQAAAYLERLVKLHTLL